MKATEKDLWIKVQHALAKGESLKIIASERDVAKSLVSKEKCFWSIDYDHIMAYERDYANFTTGIG